MPSLLENPVDLAAVLLSFEGGGPERDTVLLCNALAEAGVRISILVLHEEGPLRSIVGPGIGVVSVPGRRMRYAIPGLRRVIHGLRPNVVLSSGTTNLPTLIAIRALSYKSRPKLLLREVAVPSMARHDPYRANWIAYRVLRYLYSQADHIITLTEGARRELLQDFAIPEKMISVMHTNAVIPTTVVEHLEQWDGEAGRERDLIISLGRLSAEKDQGTLLRAVSLLPADRAWRLAIIGDGPDRARLENFVRQNGLSGRVAFTGRVVDPFVWTRKARVAVCSSIYEGLGNAIIEALASGTPVVSTDCPYGPRDILQDGRYGLLVPVGDAAAMAKAIALALDQMPDRRLLMQRGLNYTASRAAARFLEIMDKVAPRRPDAQRALAGADTP